MIKKLTSIILVCVLSLTTGFLNIASAATTDPLTEKEHELFLARQDLSNTAYTNMLWAFADNDVNKLEREYPDYYAGAYIGDNGNLVILTKNATTENISELNSICNYNGVTYKTAEHSYNELIAVMELVASRIRNAKETKLFCIDHYAIYIDEVGNQIEIGIPDLSDEELIRYLTDGIKETYYMLFENKALENYTTLTPGFGINGVGTSGSAAYKARLTYNGETKIGFMTAGHVTDGYDIYHGSYLLGLKIGDTIVEQNQGYADAAFVEITRPDYSFSNTVQGYQLVAGVTVMPAVNTEIFKIGASSGITSGTVKKTTGIVEVPGTEIEYTNLLVHTASCLSGDSGGLVYTKVGTTYKVAGIVKGSLESGMYCATKAAHVPWDVEVIS